VSFSIILTAVKNITKTRNTFCGTWYLPHSRVHNDRTVPIIMAADALRLRMHETAIFLLSSFWGLLRRNGRYIALFHWIW